MNKNILLEYESVLNAVPNSEVTQFIKTPFDIDFSKVQQVVIDKSSKGITQLMIYPNGLIIFAESTATQARIKSNWPIKEDSDGRLVIVDRNSN